MSKLRDWVRTKATQIQARMPEEVAQITDAVALAATLQSWPVGLGGPDAQQSRFGADKLQRVRKMSSAEHVYYRIAQPGVKRHHQGVVRVATSSVNAEWLGMLRTEGRTYPMEALNPFSGELSDYYAVRLQFLKRVPDDQQARLAAKWSYATTSSTAAVGQPQG